MLLTDRIELSQSSDPEVEDIFSSSIGLIFTDDLRNQHGDPGSSVVYKSPRFGRMELELVDPAGEDNRKLFSHYLWNASLQIAEFVAGEEEPEAGGAYDVKAQSVLELGAGTGLAGIVCALADASEVAISDYPAPEILSNIRKNISKNIPTTLQAHVSVPGHEWGVFSDDFSKAHKHHYTRVLAADCLWMPWQHRNLTLSILHFLSLDPCARVIVIAGFHSGRAKMAPFFDIIVEEGLEIESIYERNANGERRPWAKVRDGGREDHAERKKWLTIAILRRRR
ncbi:MAG: hypothetical protein M1834_000976 [Cirrosporium novae-zelandiae]|nr:MAG: hypothetical protein M1834_000976 [Cirrosporium novae-zelandiae]